MKSAADNGAVRIHYTKLPDRKRSGFRIRPIYHTPHTYTLTELKRLATRERVSLRTVAIATHLQRRQRRRGLRLRRVASNTSSKESSAQGEKLAEGGVGEKKSLKHENVVRAQERTPEDEDETHIGSMPGDATAKAKSKKKKSAVQAAAADVRRLSAGASRFSYLEIEGQPPVPRLWHSLDRVLFNPGVYHVQDPRSRVYNFDPYVESIMPVSEFDFDALQRFVTSSKDKHLEGLARHHGKRYVSSSSSITGVLSVFHFLLSQWRPLNIGTLSRSFPDENQNFTRLVRGPTAVYLRWRDGSYAIDADKTFDSENVLSALGQSMEKFLTRSPEDFEKFRKSNSSKLTPEERSEPNAYHYSTLGDLLVRSQLDAHDARLPGTGVFDLKTRAVVTIRMDVKNYEEMRGYEIRQRFGEYESFEREYYDMIRASFLKYSLQVRLGRMDGIFVAFHNTTRVFGFQYIPLEEMDLAIHGQTDPSLGNEELALSMEILNDVLNRVTAKYPKQASDLGLTYECDLLTYPRRSDCILKHEAPLQSLSCTSSLSRFPMKRSSAKARLEAKS